MVSTGKLVLLAVLGSFTLILGTIAITLTLLLQQRKSLQSIRRTSLSSSSSSLHSSPVHINQNYKEFAADPIQKHPLTSEAHFQLALDFFASMNSFPLGQYDDDHFFDPYNVDYYNIKKKRKRGGGGGSSSSRPRRELIDEAWYHLQAAADLGHSNAQHIIGNAMASGIFYSEEASSSFSEKSANLSKAILQWRMSAMGGNLESMLNLGFRYFSLPKSSQSSNSDDDDYGVTVDSESRKCEFAKAYYEEAANSIMDMLENGRGRGKVNPALDRHKLSEIHIKGASSKLEGWNKPDQHDDELHWFRQRALNAIPSQATSSEIYAAYTMGQYYHFGIRGIAQNLKEALRYYEIAAECGSIEGAGMAGKFHFLGIGYDASFWNETELDADIGLEEFEQRPRLGDVHKAYEYLSKGTPGGLSGCSRRIKQDDVDLCDPEALNGMGLVYLFGIPGVVDKDRKMAKDYFALARDVGSIDAGYHLGLMYLGWMEEWVEEKDVEKRKLEIKKTGNEKKKKHELLAKNDMEEDDGELVANLGPDFEKEYSEEEWLYMDANGNHLTEEEFNELLEEEGVDFANDDGADGEPAVTADADAVDAQNEEFLQQVAFAAAAGAGKTSVYEKTTTSGGVTVTTQTIIYGSTPDKTDESSQYTGPTTEDYQRALTELATASSRGHLAAAHRLGMLYSHGVFRPNTKIISYAIPPNCQASLRLFKQVSDAGPHVSRRSRRAYKQYMAGDVDSALQNYIALGETGSEIGQLNAAWLLEQGYCLSMSKENCMRASLRFWRAAARQGSSEACMRVGDFYYYGRLNNEVRRQSEQPLFNRIYGYILFPEEFLRDIKTTAVQFVKKHVFGKQPQPQVAPVCTETDEAGVCLAPTHTENTDSTPKTTEMEASTTTPFEKENKYQEDLATAASYYRKAAQGKNNPRACFNLGYMHEWGFGLKQDFPLAKRNYDLAASTNPDALVAVQLALWSMNVHEKFVKLKRGFDSWRQTNEYAIRFSHHAKFLEKVRRFVIKKLNQMGFDSNDHRRTYLEVFLLHLITWETFMIFILTMFLFRLMSYRRRT